jgi:hypothetical protein
MQSTKEGTFILVGKRDGKRPSGEDGIQLYVTESELVQIVGDQ